MLPSNRTLERFAKATGTRLRISFEAERQCEATGHRRRKKWTKYMIMNAIMSKNVASAQSNQDPAPRPILPLNMPPKGIHATRWKLVAIRTPLHRHS